MAIQGKVIIITGASSGIGEATARLLARQGAKLVLGSRRNDRLAKLVDSIQADGGKAIYQETDVVKLEDNQRLIEAALTAYGRIDAIFLNAGLMPSSPLSALQVDEWNQMIDVNLKGVLNGIAAVMPTFTSQLAGHILTTSSVAGLKAYPGGAVYGATKWA
ncbi:SDR family oxidoreductase, partial [Exiguobacterium sp.]|uniref:SDR family oxidoreductase n=1 Tax=Exiguobacterium sp. TaxID=44751 RepID=UPI0028AB52FF